MKYYEIYFDDPHKYPFRAIPMDRYFTNDYFDIDKTDVERVADFCSVFNEFNPDGARAYFEEVAAPEHHCYKFSAHSAYFPDF